MTITFQLEAQLRTVAGRAVVPVTIQHGGTLLEGVRQLGDLLGATSRGHLLQDNSQIRPSLLIVIDGETIYAEEAGQVVLNDGAEVLLMPPIADG